MDEREVGRVVRSAAESVYGAVAVVGSGWADRLADRLNLAKSGVTVKSHPVLHVTVDPRVAEGVPARDGLEDVEMELVDGGQPHSDFLISAE